MITKNKLEEIIREESEEVVSELLGFLKGIRSKAAEKDREEKAKTATDDAIEKARSKAKELRGGPKAPEKPTEPGEDKEAPEPPSGNLVRQETPVDYVVYDAKASGLPKDNDVKKKRAEYGKELAKQKAKQKVIPVFNYGYDDDGDPLKGNVQGYMPGGIFSSISTIIQNPQKREVIAKNIASTLKSYGFKVEESKMNKIVLEEIENILKEKK
tara:strand:- start:588 stop:1226 length:639 start_codon:yes stop_codon:yes gene_type:complete